MNLKSFLEGYPAVLFGQTDDEIFIYMRLMLNGMCSARLAKTINFACRFLEDRDVYLEIGTYAGFSLLSAAYESGKQFYGIDNFSQNFAIPGKVVDRLTQNIDKYPGGYTIVDGDFRNVVLNSVLAKDSKIGVFLIDGSHTYEDVKESLQWAKPFLSDQAIVFFDDLNVPGVKQAVQEIKGTPEFEEIVCANSFSDPAEHRGISTDKYIHNGFSIMAYRKEGLHVAA